MFRAWCHLGCIPLLLLSAPVATAQLNEADARVAVAVRPRAVAATAVDSAPLVRVDSSLVLIPVHVTNASGGTVTGIPRGSFRLLEDNVEQTISSFFTEDAPVSIGLLFDASGSMRSKMRKAAEAADSFFRTTDPADEFFLVEFNDRARLTVPFTQNPAEVYGQIARTKPLGRTSLIDAVHLATVQMNKARHPRKALVIFSDGGDNWSRHSVREIRSALLESDMQVYAMGIFDEDYAHNHPVEERNGPALLDELTVLTGGRHFPVEDLDRLPEISERIGRELHSQYLLGYHPTNLTRDGKYRQVKVVLQLPEARELHTSYRRGYFGPQ
jgi:Ca-activated chloride channel family protein